MTATENTENLITNSNAPRGVRFVDLAPIVKEFKDVGITLDDLIQAIQILQSANGLKIDNPIGATFQVIKDKNGNATGLQVSDTRVKATNDIIVGEVNTPSGTFTVQGFLAGLALYDRNYDSSLLPIIYTNYSNNGNYRVYQQGVLNEDVIEVDKTTGYGKFNKGSILRSVTTAAMKALPGKIGSLTVYNTDLKKICFYNGVDWEQVTSTVVP